MGELTQGGPPKGGLHGVAVEDAHAPHHNSACAFLALLHLKVTTLKRELKRNPNPPLNINWQTQDALESLTGYENGFLGICILFLKVCSIK